VSRWTFVAIFLSHGAAAGEIVDRVDVLQTGHGYTQDNVYVLVTVAGIPISQPACATDPRFAINPTTSAGKALFTLLALARGSGAMVEVVGTGDCNVMNGWESISFMRVRD
jgi:hypothetical protein